MKLQKLQKVVHEHKPLIFPAGFLWGSATSAHQVEGNNQHNDWWRWEQIPDKIAGNQKSSRAVDHYRLYQEDFELAKKLNQNAHRLSLEWSRLEPHQGEWDEHEVEHYQNVLRDLKAKGFTVFLTLHHFTNPVWLADIGGWENPAAVKFFERYVRFAINNFAPWVDFWITINEPMIYLTQGYVFGTWPPGKKSFWSAIKVFFTICKAHRQAYKLIHQHIDRQGFSARVGIANSIISYYTYKKHSLLDLIYLKISDYVWNHAFYERTRGSHDFLGVNYYFHQRIKRTPGVVFQFFFDVKAENREMSDIGWEIYPQGIFDVLLDLKDYNLPIYITENGIATLNDDKRARFLVSYLKEIYHAIQSGIDVKGYFYWSLMDNFEWEKGFEPSFGLVHVDLETMKRTVKSSAKIYAKISKENAIPHDLLRFVGHLVTP